MGGLSLRRLFGELSNGIVDTTGRSCWVLLVNREVLTLRLVASGSCAIRDWLLGIDQGCFESGTSYVLILVAVELARPLRTHPPVHRIQFLLLLALSWQILCRHVVIFAVLIRSHTKFVLAILLVSSRG